MQGEQPNPDAPQRFIGSFGPQDRPDVIMMTGGEPMLLTELVAGLAESARHVGTRSAVLTGAVFASRPRIPEAGVRTVREHADIDTGHTDAVFDLLDALALSAAQTSAVATNGLDSTDALISPFARIPGGRRTEDGGAR